MVHPKNAIHGEKYLILFEGSFSLFTFTITVFDKHELDGYMHKQWNKDIFN